MSLGTMTAQRYDDRAGCGGWVRLRSHAVRGDVIRCCEGVFGAKVWFLAGLDLLRSFRKGFRRPIVRAKLKQKSLQAFMLAGSLTNILLQIVSDRFCSPIS